MRYSWLIAVFTLTAIAGGCATGSPDDTTDGGRDIGLDGGTADLGADAGAPDAGPAAGICQMCRNDDQCGLGARCVQFGENFICLETCPSSEFTGCPRTFECATLAGRPGNFCIPTEGCCIDEDNDNYGVGVACDGPDCNDDDASVNPHPATVDVCNGVNDDCDDATDEDPTNCRGPICDFDGVSGYAQAPAEVCTLGVCTAGSSTSCQLRACELGGGNGDICAANCAPMGTDDDVYCTQPAHCESGNCLLDVPNGGTCDEASDCTSGNCVNGVCCGTDRGGVCCSSVSQCMGSTGGSVCSDIATCQGQAGSNLACTNFQCEVLGGNPDDTSCGPTTRANDCGYFVDVFCTGAADQVAPTCRTTCTSNNHCDEGAHCDDGACLPNVTNGNECDEFSDCVSGYCDLTVPGRTGLCCNQGSADCCAFGSDCAAQGYGAPATCSTPTACQGTRTEAICQNNACMNMVGIADDSACTSMTQAANCSPYQPNVFCNGGVDQMSPSTCPTSCTQDSQCISGFHCDGTCVPNVVDGGSCDEASDCTSNYCANGFCCVNNGTNPLCCGGADFHCDPLDVAPTCVSVTQPGGAGSSYACSGAGAQGQCAIGFRCQANTIADANACNGTVANPCGAYPSSVCTGGTAPACATSCPTVGGTAACDPGAVCTSGTPNTCQSPGGPGNPCTVTNECQAGLTCAQGVCCQTACDGICNRCDTSGNGTCTPVPNGQDPFSACNGFPAGQGCEDNYFSGFGGANNDICYRKQPLTAAAHVCNGTGQCRTQAQSCPSQPNQVTPQINCNDQCQAPTAGTCTTGQPGQCTNTSSLTTCGYGVCRTTTWDQCLNGSFRGCNNATQGNQGARQGSDTCGGFSAMPQDEDCDNAIDEGTPVDGLEANNSCGAARGLTNIGTMSGGNVRDVAGSIWTVGDVDYYQIVVDETGDGGPTCRHSGFCDEEDHELTAVLSVPNFAGGAYEVCVDAGTDCSFDAGACRTVNAGATGWARDWYRRASCKAFGGSGTFTIRVRATGSAAICVNYGLQLRGAETCDQGSANGAGSP